MALILGTDPCKNIKPPTYLSFFTASSSILIAIVVSVGNSLVVIAVIWNPYNDLRTTFNYFVGSLSLADLVVGLILAPLSTIFHIFEGLGKLEQFQPFEHTVYEVYFIFCTASLFSLTALAFDRYLAIMHPLSYRNHLNPARAFLISALLWIVSILLSMVYFIVELERYRFIFANIAVGVTIIELIFTHAKILKHLRQQMQEWDTLNERTEENLIMKQLMMWEKKMTKTLVIVMLLFLVFYLPSYVFICIINLCTVCDCMFINWIRDIQWLLIMTTSAVNPFVYAWRLENYRRVFRSIVTCRNFVSVLNHSHQPL